CVERAGDVIPYMAEVIEVGDGEKADVSRCPVCGETLVREGANLYCRNPECSEQVVNKLYFSVATLGMFGVGKEMVRAAVERLGVKDILGFMRLTHADLQRLEGFGETKAANVMDEIEKARHCQPARFLEALNIPELGGKASELLLGKFSFDEILEGPSPAELMSVPGIGEIMAARISAGLRASKAFVVELRKDFEFEKAAAPAESKGTVCFTGKSTRPRSEMHKAAMEKGYIPVESFSKSVDILVTADVNSNSGKAKKAREWGTRLLSEEEFWKL
ncbi:MAG: hypothetical protein J6Y62_00610, partial [Clostridia bacterium]|nr:hypothetical protein [Clostridia bacterium]